MSLASTGFRRSAAVPFSGILCVLGGTIFYCTMDGLVKWLAPDYPIIEITFFRMLFSFIPLGVLVLYDPKRNTIKTQKLSSHILRCLFGTAGMIIIFQSVALMPLVDVTVILFACPLFIAVLSWPILRERVSPRSWIAVVFGFVCVAFAIGPTGAALNTKGLLPLLGTLCIALYIISARLLSETESTTALAFYMNIVGLVATACMLPFYWQTPSLGDLALMAAVGIIGGTGLVLRTTGYRITPPAVAAPLEYTSILWSGLIGYALFGEAPAVAVVVAGFLIIGANLYLLHASSTQKARTRVLAGEAGRSANGESAAATPDSDTPQKQLDDTRKVHGRDGGLNVN